jgi:50S ribosomal subunit-associated GTPase HflX
MSTQHVVAWTRLVRYVPQGDDQIRYGEPILSSSVEDIVSLAEISRLQVKVCDGNDPFTAKPTERVETVKKLLGPLDQKDVPIIRCIGLNYKTHSIVLNLTHMKKQAENIFLSSRNRSSIANLSNNFL